MSEAGKLSKRLSLERIRAAGLEPRTVLDVGVATGTNGLYGVFPDARYALIEPLEESAPFMRALVDRYPGSVAVHAAAGRAAGTGELVVNAGLSGSSFLLKPAAGQVRTVPVVAIDDVIAEHGLEPPFVIKLDVQGYELEALAGAEQALKHTIAVIAETSLWSDRKGKGMPTTLELMTWMQERGFVLYDIAQIVRRQLDGAVTELDLVFCPAASPLRAVASYKSPEQLEGLIEKRRRAFGLSETP